MHVCMLGEHESSDELRGQKKKCKGESYTAEGRIKVNSPKLLPSEREGGISGAQTRWWCWNLGGGWGRKGGHSVWTRGRWLRDSSSVQRVQDSGYVVVTLSIHFDGKGGVAFASWGVSGPRPTACPLGFYWCVHSTTECYQVLSLR